MSETMNKAQHVAALFKSQAEMARVIGRHPAIVTRMVHKGAIPWHFNKVLLEWADLNDVREFMEPNLEPVCPCCGKELT